MELLYEIEFAILEAIQQLRCPFLDALLGVITRLGDGGIFWIGLSVILCLPKKTRKWGVTMLFALAFGAIVCNLTLKPLIARERPYNNPLGMYTFEQLEAMGIHLSSDYSFPSGHTTASFAAAVGMFLRNKKWGSVALVTAVLIAFSRLYLYVHFPTDVLFGMAFGTTAALLSYLLWDKLTASKRCGQKLEAFWNFSFSKKAEQ